MAKCKRCKDNKEGTHFCEWCGAKIISKKETPTENKKIKTESNLTKLEQAKIKSKTPRRIGVILVLCGLGAFGYMVFAGTIW